MQTLLNIGVDVAKDAVVVACAAQSFPVHSIANQRKLDRLIRRRAKIVRIKSTLKLTMSNLNGFTAELKAVLLKPDALIARIDAAMSTIAASSPQHEEAQQRLQTIVGVGPVVSMAPTNTLERLPFRNAEAFVAFTGFDP